MRTAVWQTGHEISKTISQSLARGFNANLFNVSQVDEVNLQAYDAHIAYGILRGTADIFARVSNWFEVDRGYHDAEHYGGKYRISYRGTQARYDSNYVCAESNIALEPLRYNDGHVLVCPPTPEVCRFFGIHMTDWLLDVQSKIEGTWFIRWKGNPNPINWNEIKAVVTFNSSVGWEAVRRGIPCISDTEHSSVGSYYKDLVDFSFSEFYNIPREPLFNFMNAHQFTLQEIEQGQAWQLLNHYVSQP